LNTKKIIFQNTLCLSCITNYTIVFRVQFTAKSFVIVLVRLARIEILHLVLDNVLQLIVHRVQEHREVELEVIF